MKYKVQLSNRIWLAWTLGAGLLVLSLAVVGLVFYRMERDKRFRCYWLSPPLTHTETYLLNKAGSNCLGDNCRIIINTELQRGLMCYYPQPFPASSLMPP